MNKKFDNKLLMQAWEEIIKQRMENIPSEDELKKQLQFSPEIYENGIQKYYQKLFFIGGHAISRIAVYIIIIVLLGSSITVYAMYKAKLIEKIFDKNSDIIIEDIDKTDYKTIIEESYLPVYVPSGYDYVGTMGEENKEDTDLLLTIYTNGNYEIYFTQQLYDSVNRIDNEYTNQERVIVNKNEAVYFIKNEEPFLLWSEYGYIFYINTNALLSKEEIIKIAESIQKNISNGGKE